MINVDQLISELIGREGAYVNNPADKGGETIWGITAQVARANGYAGPMKAMPRDTAIGIYLKQYWQAPRFDAIALLCPELATELFDAGVNMGTVQAGKFAQRALNLLNRQHTDYPDMLVDGQLGAVSRAGLAAYLRVRAGAEGVAVLLLQVRAFRAVRYAEIAEANPSQETFSYGWLARLVRLIRLAA